MPQIDLLKFRGEVRSRLEKHRNDDAVEAMKRVFGQQVNLLGIKVPALREMARNTALEYRLSPDEWARYISLVVQDGLREEILIGAFGLGKSAKRLDDLFGERVGGWGRFLNNWETVDQISVCVGEWVFDDLSRIGYLEAWAAHGETSWKRRLAAASTVTLNHAGRSQPVETFRVLRHLMTAKEPEVKKAIGWAIREVKDEEQVERFLAWWAPRISKGLLTEATKKLSPESRRRLQDLA